MRVRHVLKVLGPGLTAGMVMLSTSLTAGPVEDEIEKLLSTVVADQAALFGDTKLDAKVVIPEFYAQRNYTPSWYGTQNEEDLFAELNRGVAQGFRPADFNLPLLYEVRDAAQSGRAEDIARFDLLATDAAIKLIHHVVFGKVDPAQLDSTWNFSKPVIRQEPSVVLNQYINGEGFGALMARVDLDNPQYGSLVAALQKYRAIETAGGWPVVPDETVLKPGISDPAVAILRERLAREGMDAAPDALVPISLPTTDLYDDTLVELVKSFQARHGLEADGAIGPKTFASLNKTAGERVDQIELSLERARWIMRDLEDEFVLVNIAGARTFYVKSGTVWTTRSITGSAYRKTPVFRDEIEYLEFNPTWTVPASIFRKDKLPKIRKDPGYLARNGYVVVRSSDRTPVNAAAVNWASDNPGVTLVQQPGPQNALGLVKFMFPNDYAVYLHDTNERGLFDRNERNLSSGCVRLEYPFEFAELLLEGQPEWSSSRMAEILDSGKTTRINLETPVPVLLTYWTAWVEEGDVVHFREDPYDRDGPILEALNR